MKKITLALLSVLLITALGGCKSTTPQTADKNVKPALMWFDAEACLLYTSPSPRD